MNAGREMDALVAEKVMGYEIKPGGYTGYLPGFSTDIAAAWEVVEKLNMFGRADLGGGLVLLRHMETRRWEVQDEAYLPWACGDTAPHAICLAALKAVGVEV